MNKKKYFINKKNIHLIDKNFKNENKPLLEKEIENIIDNIWIGTKQYQDILKPLCTSHLNITWLKKTLYFLFFD